MANDERERLYRAGRYDAVIEAAEQRLGRDPDDREARYCLAAARVMDGQFLRGLTLMMDLLRRFYDQPGRAGGEGRSFCGECGLQIAELGEFFYHKERLRLDGDDKARLISFAISGAATADWVARDAGDAGLRGRARAVLARLRRGASGDQPPPILIPESPLALQVEPTNACNMACAMCPRRQMTRSIGFLDPALLTRLLGTWSNARTHIRLAHLAHVGDITAEFRGSVKLFFMGEPLLHPQIDELIRIVKASGAFAGLQTNGLLLCKPDIRARLLGATPDSIGISLDGVTSAAYEAVRKGGVAQAVFEGIRALRKERDERGLAGAVPIEVSAIRTQASEEETGRIRRFLDPIRDAVDGVNFITLNRLSRPEFPDEQGVLREFGGTPGPAPVAIPPCEEPFQKLNVMWDGAVTPCCNDWDAQIVLGRAEEGVDAVWRGERATDLREGLLALRLDAYPFCRRCLGRA